MDQIKLIKMKLREEKKGPHNATNIYFMMKIDDNNTILKPVDH